MSKELLRKVTQKTGYRSVPRHTKLQCHDNITKLTFRLAARKVPPQNSEGGASCQQST